ncbi:MAG: hypothetical protein ACR2I8_10735 [Steroidobacteraceae bacterium]
MAQLPRPVRRHRAAILLFALLMFGLAQAAAIAHAARHWGSDAAGLPGDHSQLCTDCASMLPLLVVAGGLGAALALVGPAAQTSVPRVAIRCLAQALRLPFRSRAPPR